MHGQREALKDQANVFVFCGEFFKNGMGIFAVWALQVAEIYNRDWGVGGAARWSIYATLQLLLIGGEGMCAEWHDFSVDGVFAVGRDVEFELLLALRAA